MHVHPPATYAKNSPWVTCVPLLTVMSGQWRAVGRVTKCVTIATASRGLTEAHGQAAVGHVRSIEVQQPSPRPDGLH